MAQSPLLEIPEHFNIASHFVDRPALQHPERVAIVGEPAAVSYGQLRKAVSRAAGALRGMGCSPGDRVLLVLPDSAEFFAAFFGAARMGAVAVPVNPMTRVADYAHYLEDSEARFAVVHQIAAAEFFKAAERFAGIPGGLKTVLLVGRDPASLLPHGPELKVMDWNEALAEASADLPAHPTRATDMAFFLYTSGSGGTPKAAVHQHKDMLVTAHNYSQQVLGLSADDVTFSVSKLFFAYGLGNGMYFPLSAGATTLLSPEKPGVDRIVELVKQHRPTVFFAVPTFYAALLQDGGPDLGTVFACVRLAVSAGEALPAEVFLQFRKRCGLDILDGIGSTEMLHIFVSSRPGAARPGSCGFEVPGYEARIVGDDGEAVQDGNIGNLWVKGQSALAKYWSKPELTARTLRGEWVLTGDKFVRDAAGYYHHCGRSDDMLKIRGMWVSPGEVENALLAHPAVAEAAVVGRSDAVGLVFAVAYVIPAAASAAGEVLARELREFLAARLPTYKRPAEIHFLSELPKTATGKIQRFRLRE